MTAIAKQLDPSALTPGVSAPDFDLPTDDGHVRLSQFRGKKNVLVYFYPKDDTPGCTKQACAARDLAGDFEDSNTVVIGISKDDVTSHSKFRKKYQLSHILACDADGKVMEDYGAWGEKNLYGKISMGVKRSIFLVDKQGKIAQAWPSVKAEGSIEKALEYAKKLA